MIEILAQVDGPIVTALGAVIGAQSVALAKVYRDFLREREDCRKDRVELWKRIHELESRL